MSAEKGLPVEWGAAKNVAWKVEIPGAGWDQGLLCVSSGGYVFGDFNRPLYAVRAGASGDITLKGSDTSNAGVFDMKTGKPVYSKQRIDRDASGFTASPWAYDGKIFCLSEDGDTFVIEAGPEFKVIGKNSLHEMCMATPAISHGLFVRGRKHLYCIRPQGADG